MKDHSIRTFKDRSAPQLTGGSAGGSTEQSDALKVMGHREGIEAAQPVQPPAE